MFFCGFLIPEGVIYAFSRWAAVSGKTIRAASPGTPETGKERIMTELTIEAYQEKVDEWVTTIGVRYFSELTNTAVLMEEVGEVARIMARRYGDQSSKGADKDHDLGDELADVLFVVACIANQTGIDLTRAVNRNFQKKSTRDRTRHRNNPKLGS